MTTELPTCKLCGQKPTQLSGGRVSHICVVSEAEWRRLRGPRRALTGTRLGDVLARHDVIDAAAVEDPDGYDGARMLNSLAMAARELADDAAQPLPQPPLSADDMRADLRRLATPNAHAHPRAVSSRGEAGCSVEDNP